MADKKSFGIKNLMKDKNILMYVVGFPLVFHIMVYYGFQSSYFDYKSQVAISDFYYQNIYAYRLVSREILEEVFSVIQKLFEADFPFKDYALKKGTLYYHSLFLLNTFFAICTSLMLNFLLKNQSFFKNIDTQKRLVINFIMASVMALSQFVAVHYDNSAIFFMLIGICFSLNYYEKRQFQDLLWLCIVITISALNRETAALNISFLAALFIVNYKDFRGIWKTSYRTILPVVLAFLLPYMVLRIFIPQEKNEGGYFFESITLVNNFTSPNNIIGIFYGLILFKFLYFFVGNRENKILMNRFLFFSLPYIAMIFLVGIMWEVRLYIPIFYGLVLLAFLDIKKS